MPDTIIDELFKKNKETIDYLDEKKELTFFVQAKDNFSKILVLSIGSYFEFTISDMILEFAKNKSSNDLICHFIKNKAVSRQYHTYFDWNQRSEKKNANRFYSLFGQDFKTKCEQKVNADKDLEKSVAAFIELGVERNKLIHTNLAASAIDKTLEEYYELYKQASKFLHFVKSQLNEK